MHLPYNLHLHSHKSKCAKPEMTLENIVQQAQRLGFELIGISDHINRPEDSAEFLLETRQELENLTNYRVLIGVEVTQLAPDQLSLADEMAGKFDYVIVASNHYHLRGVAQPDDPTPAGFARHHLQMLEGALNWPFTDILAHPFLIRRQNDDGHFDWDAFTRAIDRGHLRELLAHAQARDVAFEINVHAFRQLPELHREMIETGRALGTRFTPATDAHKLEQLDFDFFFPDPANGGCRPETLGLFLSDLVLPEKIQRRIQAIHP